MAQYTELRYFHLPPKLAQQTSLQVININNLISELQLLINTKVDKLYNKQLSLKNFTIVDKNAISKSLNQIVDLLNLIDSLPDIVLSDWNTLDVDDMSYIKNKPNVPILDLSGLIPASYLPSYVDDILEYPSFHDLPQPGEPGKIYVTTDNDLTYRWSGTTYIEISKSIITGVKGDAETDYRIGNVNLTAANIGLGNVVNLDLSKAIKGITRNGLTFTYTCLDGTTGTFDQQDNNTTYSAGTGLLLTNTAFSVKLGYTTSGNNRAVQADANGNLYVTLKDDNTWTAWKGATASADGTAGYMPAPTKAQYLLFLRGDGTWVSLNNYSLPLAADGTRGGILIGYTQSGKNYPVLLSSEKAYVNVPWTDTTYNFAGVSFSSGQSNTGEHDANKITSNGVWYYTSNGPAKTLGASTDGGALYSQAYSTSWVGQIAQDYRNGRLFVRGKNNNSWLSWLRVALTGESLPASDVYAWAKASTKPSYTLDEVSDGSTRKLENYLPLAGGIMTGKLTVKAPIFGYNYSSAGNNAAAFIFDKPGSNYTGIGAHLTSSLIWFGACDSDGTWVDTFKQSWLFNGSVTADSFKGDLSGNASSATKLNTDAGGANTPVYFSGGKPVACTAYSSASVNYATSSGNADTVDNFHASGLTKFYLSPMDSGATASSAKQWFVNTMPSGAGAIVYNVPGSERTIIVGKSSGSYGHMLRLGYDNTYPVMLRYQGGTWKSTDWEKISAGYADSAGSDGDGNTITSTYLKLSGGTITGRLVINAASSPSRLMMSSVNSTGNSVIDFTEDTSGNIHHFQILDKYSVGLSTENRFLIFHVDGSGSAISIQKSATPTIGIGGKTDLYTGGAGVLYVYGAASATAWNTHSDIRSKDIKEDANISVETIANAPLFYFYWKNKQDEDKHVGTSAQYWLKVLPEVITGNDEVRLHMDYSVTALTSAITVAREVVKQDKKIKLLEEENKQLKEELLLLKSQINDILTTINKSTNNK